MPRVSVVVPNYNYGRFLERRIQSILEQTYQNFELIVLDDASTDNSVHILDKYRANPRIRIIANEANSGCTFAQWNRGVQVASGEFVWIAEADDDAEPELLEALVQELDQCSSAVLAYCESWIIDENSKRLRTVNSRTSRARWSSDFQSRGCEEARRYLVFANTIPNASAVVFRRSVFLQAGGAPTSMQLCGDWMMWSLLAMEGDILFVARPLNLFREHANTVRASTTNLRCLQEWFEVIAAVEAKLGIPEDVRQELAMKILSDWKGEYWCHKYRAPLPVVLRVGSFLWRMDSVTATKFFLFFALSRAPERLGLLPARKLWKLYKRLIRAAPVRSV